MDTNNRTLQKANRNLYSDQILYISMLAKKLKVSDSEIMRQIIDLFIAAKEDIHE